MYQKELTKIKQFLDNYNLERTQEGALTSGISASVRRNALYSPDCTNKLNIHEFWTEELINLGSKYLIKKQTIETFKNDIVILCNAMNEKFWNDFKSRQYTHDPGFRISHAQKSLSIYLKHMWCMEVENKGDIKAVVEYPVCPMDRRILCVAKCPDVRWGNINSIEVYENKLQYIIEASKRAKMSMARWELMVF